MARSQPYRLPRLAVPRRYELELEPDLEGARFQGTVDVSFEVMEATPRLVVHAAELEITEAVVRTPSGMELAGAVSLEEPEQRATISLDRTLEPGRGYSLHLRFNSSLNNHLQGFYRTTYRDADGSEQVIAATQFEPTDARRCFPCWDEPDLKAVFAISVVIDEGLTALSNEPPISEEPLPGGRKRVRFAETPVMSTYLVAMVVGRLELTDPVEVDGVPLRVTAVPGKLHLAPFAVEAASHALRFFCDYFQIPYPGRKLDHVAIPDFTFGAMENLGCVTYRENALLVDPAAASQVELQRVASVIAHETAHMWFGDLVTMRWWNGVWLNEAFATFMELTATDSFNPAWAVWTTFGAGKAAALVTDGLRSTRPVEFEVGRPEEAEAMFDVLTYQKGGAVLRMLEQYLGAQAFRKGINHYLRMHAYANTEAEDLWDSLETVSAEPVRAIMQSWISRGGYPLITAQPGESAGSITLRQERFVYSSQAGEDRWKVPVNLRASVGGQVQRQRTLLDDGEATVSFDAPIDWVVVNDGAWGFYRVRYDAALLRLLTGAGLRAVCAPLERMALVSDTWAMVVAGTAGLEEWASLVRSLGDEDDPDVWSAITGVTDLLHLIADAGDEAALGSFLRSVAGPVWARLGWEPRPGEPERLRVARGLVLAALGLVGADDEVRRESALRFERFQRDRSALGADLVTPVARVVAASGGEPAWSCLLGQYRAAATPQDKLRYLHALASTREPVLLARTLELTLGEEVRTQDGAFVVAGVMAQRAGGRLAWEWVESHWHEIRERFPPPLVTRMIEGVSAVVDPEVAAAVHRFAESHDIPVAGPRLDQALERMDLNVALGRRLRGQMAPALTG